MSWNYRIIKRVVFKYIDKDNHDVNEDVFGIHEVYYKDDGDIEGWTSLPIRMDTYSVEDLKWMLEKIQLAFDKPVIDYDEESVKNKLKRLQLEEGE